MEKCPICSNGNVTLQRDIIVEGMYSYECECKLCDTCGTEFADDEVVNRNKQHYLNKALI